MDRLLKFGIHVPQSCIFYDLHVETLEHLFFGCIMTKKIWQRLLQWLIIQRIVGCWEEKV